MKRIILFLLIWLIFVTSVSAQVWQSTEAAIIPNGKLDNIEEMIDRTYRQVPMSDGAKMWLDITLPQYRDTFSVDNLQLSIGGALRTIPRLHLGDPGLQYFIYPHQADPYRLPVIFSRTPYGAFWWHQGGQSYSVMGFCGIINDMRGKFNSEGTYYPMYSDAWRKDGYYSNGHTLDITPNHAANYHEDGYELLQYITNHLRRDTNGDNTEDSLICNGNIGMFGASAVGNSQLQAAATRYVDTDKPGLKCLFPVNATAENYRYSGYQGGCFRMGLVELWMWGQMATEWFAPYDTLDAIDTSVLNGIKTLRDYGIDVNDFPSAEEAAKHAALVSEHFWTTKNRAYYPNSAFRASMDCSIATMDSNGNGMINGPVNRYTNLDVPTYHFSGWWDIFCEGQLETWRLQRKYSTKNRRFQKIVIGPWSHNTCGERKTGDVTYKPNCTQYNKVNLDGPDTQEIALLQQGEVLQWFRQFLSEGREPVFHLPARTNWQSFNISGLGQVEILAPAFDFNGSYANWYNYFNAMTPLDSIPVITRIVSTNEQDTLYVTLPKRSTKLIYHIEEPGDIPRTRSDLFTDRPPVNFDDSAPDGEAPIRFYVVGPVNDGIAENETVGNYWFSADTFPLPNEQRVKMYFHADGNFNFEKPITDEGEITYVADPQNPVPTHGGNNMEERTPDDLRESLGQMNFRDPAYVNEVLERPLLNVGGTEYPDLIAFTSGPLLDTFSTIGQAVVKLYDKSRPYLSFFPQYGNHEIVVRVLDVTPDGKELFVMEGSVNSRCREYVAHIAETGVEDVNIPFVNTPANQMLEYTFPMQPMAYTFGKGHRIKVLISGTNFYRLAPSFNIPIEDDEYYFRSALQTELYTFENFTLPPQIAITTMKFSDVYSAYIDFPIVGAVPELGSTAGVQEAEGKTFAAEIYPNPASDMLNIDPSLPGIYLMEIFDGIGKQVLAQKFDDITAVDVSEWISGIYMIQLTHLSKNINLTKKVIVE